MQWYEGKGHSDEQKPKTHSWVWQGVSHYQTPVSIVSLLTLWQPSYHRLRRHWDRHGDGNYCGRFRYLPVNSNQHGAIDEDVSKAKRRCFTSVILRHQWEMVHSAFRDQLMQSRNETVRSKVYEGTWLFLMEGHIFHHNERQNKKYDQRYKESLGTRG